MNGRIASLLFVLWCLQVPVFAQPIWIQCATGDPALVLLALPGIAGDSLPELVAGHDSGTVTCMNVRGERAPVTLWSATLEGSILNLKTLPDVDADGFPEIVATTDRGIVACIRAGGNSAGTVRWSLEAVFNISELAILNDVDRDGMADVAFGGADHRVHLVSGSDGKEIWTRLLECRGDIAYLDCLSNAGDLNGDGIDDLFARTWAAHHWGISGSDGTDVWPPQQGDFYLSTMLTANDANGDGIKDLLVSGNDGILRLCNGKDGIDLWNCDLGRPIRSIAISEKNALDGAFDCIGGTAEGAIGCLSSASRGTATPRWTAEIGDVCRALVCLPDITGEGKQEVVGGAENGVVAAFSGEDGKQIWKWQGPDVVRTLISVGDVDRDGAPDLAVSCLDGTLALLPGKPSESFFSLAGKQIPFEPRKRKRPAPSSDEVKEVPILLYHDVPPKGLGASDSSPLENFREHMDFLAAGGYTAVSLDEIADWIDGKIELPAKPVCITFDGQYASHLTHLSKILLDRGLFGISYITTDWIGTSNHLDWHELRALERSGAMEIENHSINHPTFTTVSSDEVVRQVSLSRQAIARHLEGKDSRHHAYPNGFSNGMAQEVLREQGFRTATAVIARRAVRTDNLFNFPRYTIAEDMSLASFKVIMACPDTPYPLLPYENTGTVGAEWRQPSYGDVDGEGKLWVCDYSAGAVRVFLPNGEECSFSPIVQGMNQEGESIAMAAPSGIAASPSGEMVVSIDSRFGAVRHQGLFRFRASDGQPLPGINLEYAPGDLDIDAKGWIYVVSKLTAQWHLYGADGVEVSGSPFGENDGLHIQRGIAVLPDSSRVYVISESAARINVWERNTGQESIGYTRAGTLIDHLSYQSGAVDTLPDGTVLASCNEEGMILALNNGGEIVGLITGGSPSLNAPRGVACSSDGSTLWILSRYGQVQRWDKKNPEGR